MLRFSLRLVVAASIAALSTPLAPLAAQAARQLTAADYDRAVRYLPERLTDMVVGGAVTPNWQPDGRFWYANTTLAGREIVAVDPARPTRQVCPVTATTCGGLTIPASAAGTGGGRGGGRGGGGGGGRGGAGGAGQPPMTISPDSTKGAFIRDWNLWVRDIATGQERQLTRDGVKDFGYATDNAGWRASDRAVLLWSPDSKKIATQQQDERLGGEMYLATTNVGRPTLRAWKYPLPGDSVVAMLHRVIIEVESGRIVRLQLPPEYHRATLGDDISMNDYNWSPDGSRLALVSTGRDHKNAIFRVADANTGAVRTLFEETVTTHFESRTGWRVLWNTNEIIWYSQKDDWGHLYLHDLNTGQLKNRITSGDGPVTQIVRIDERTRTLWFAANGREPGRDPYFRHYYRIGLDGRNYALLTPDDGDHTMSLSPDGRYLVDTYSTADRPPVVTLRDASNGRLILDLERADISRLVATGWKPPIRITVKAADGRTDLYGMMFVPTNLDPSRKYPIVNQAYPGPQSGSVGSRSFAAARGDRQALAELGFIVVSIDGRGTPGRSKSFHDHYYGAMGRDNTIPDQVAGMQDLARQYSYIDIDRAGMWGHSGGGFITAGAMLRYPDFFKVGVAQAGNHDQRNYEDDWGERYQGLLVRNADGTDNYAAEANQTMAANLKGKLLLAHGGMDNNVPPYNTYLLVDALVKANKDFDLIIFPNAAHGFGVDNNYMMRRRWDYFVTHLAGNVPPAGYEIRAPGAGGRGAQ